MIEAPALVLTSPAERRFRQKRHFVSNCVGSFALRDAINAEVSPLSSLRVKKATAKPEISDQIGRQLRSVYNDILAQPVPDRFLDLLKDLDGIPGLPGGDANVPKKAVKQ